MPAPLPIPYSEASITSLLLVSYSRISWAVMNARFILLWEWKPMMVSGARILSRILKYCLKSDLNIYPKLSTIDTAKGSSLAILFARLAYSLTV